MRWNGQGDAAILQLDKEGDKLFPVGTGGGIQQELQNTFLHAGISMYGKFGIRWDADDNLKVDGDDALWIWAHGNRHRDVIGAGAGERYSPVTLAEKIEQLDKASTGNVVVWSCWAGVLGGFAEQFAAFMINSKGYVNLRFWGATTPTSIVKYSNDGSRWKNVELLGGGRIAAGLIDPGVRMPDIPTVKDPRPAPATRGNMNGFGPGLIAPYLRTKTIDTAPTRPWAGHQRPVGSAARPRPQGW